MTMRAITPAGSSYYYYGYATPKGRALRYSIT